jgi:ABC-type multidrug transport system ATPase subunit
VFVIALGASRCVLLDEPYAGIAPSIKPHLWTLIKEFVSLGARSALIVGHQGESQEEEYDQVHSWPVPQDGPSDLLALQSGMTIDPPEARPTHVRPWRIKSLKIGTRELVRDLHILARPGSLLIVSGPNGSGKSTLLRCIAGVSQPWTGTSTESEAGPPRSAVFFGPQAPRVAGDLTGEQNLELMVGLGVRPDARRLRVARELLVRFGLPLGRLRPRAEVLSGGEVSKLCLVGASCSPAQVLVLDEPFESLDSASRHHAHVLIRRVLHVGRTVVASLHSGAPGSSLELDLETAVSGSWGDAGQAALTAPSSRKEKT